VVDAKRLRRIDASHHRDDAKAGCRQIGIELTDQRHCFRIEADLFLGLAERGRRRARIAGVDLAAGKGDLPGVRGQAGRAQGEQHR
jgi:hypothetical protein